MQAMACCQKTPSASVSVPSSLGRVMQGGREVEGKHLYDCFSALFVGQGNAGVRRRRRVAGILLFQCPLRWAG